MRSYSYLCYIIQDQNIFDIIQILSDCIISLDGKWLFYNKVDTSFEYLKNFEALLDKFYLLLAL